jgi:hypothetical protein
MNGWWNKPVFWFLCIYSATVFFLAGVVSSFWGVCLGFGVLGKYDGS